jgi:hypothetical protein
MTALVDRCARRRLALVLLALSGLAWLPLGHAAAAGPATELIRLAPPVADGSLAPRLAQIDDRRTALTWLERSEAGHQLRYAMLEGDRFGPARTVAEGSFFANWADTPGLTVTQNGAWVAHWLQRSGSGTYAYDVRVALSHDEGRNWSASLTPHRDGTRTEHGFVSYYPDPEGTGLAWLDGRNTLPAPTDRSGNGHHHAEDGAMTLRTAVLRPDGTLTREALLDDRVCDCCTTASARTSEGPVVVYRDRSESEIRDIGIVRGTPAGWSVPEIVHEDGWKITGCPVNGPAVIAKDQTVIVAWFTLGADEEARVHLARSEDGGRNFGEPMTFDRGSAIGRVDLAWRGPEPRSEVLLSWMARDGEGAQLRLARLDGEGALLERRNVIRLPGSRGNGFPRLLTLDEGDAVFTWTEGTTNGPRVQVGRLTLDP